MSALLLKGDIKMEFNVNFETEHRIKDKGIEYKVQRMSGYQFQEYCKIQKEGNNDKILDYLCNNLVYKEINIIFSKNKGKQYGFDWKKRIPQEHLDKFIKNLLEMVLGDFFLNSIRREAVEQRTIGK